MSVKRCSLGEVTMEISHEEELAHTMSRLMKSGGCVVWQLEEMNTPNSKDPFPANLLPENSIHGKLLTENPTQTHVSF